MSSIKIRAKAEGGVTTVKALMSHPMETGQRKDKKTGKLVPAHFIETISAEYNGKKVLDGFMSGGISQNPYLSFKFAGGAAGESVKLTWTDNNGGTETAEDKIG